MYHNINFHTMMGLKEFKKFWKEFPSVEASEDAFYCVFEKEGFCYVIMYNSNITAFLDAFFYNGEVINYSQLLSFLGNGKKLFFCNFYLS